MTPTPYEQAQELRRIALPQLVARKADLERLLTSGPSKSEDYTLLVSVLAFALAEVSCFEGNKLLPPSGNKN